MPRSAGAFKKGRDPRRHPGGNKNAGRKPVAFIAECEGLADTDVLEACRKKLATRDVDDAGWRWAAEYVSKYGKSEAPKRTELTGANGGELVVRVVRD